MPEETIDFNSCSCGSCPRLEYGNLMSLYPDTQSLKKAIVTAIWNDDRLLRSDIADIAYDILSELKRG
jgi:hypothetical protein